MDPELQETLDALRSAIDRRDADAVEDAIRQLESFLEEGVWPVDVFETVRRLLLDPRFLPLRTSYGIARLIQHNWQELSEAQRTDLEPALASAFDKFGDWLGTFVVAEIFGDLYADDEAFATLDRLSSSAATRPACALAAYGLGRLARTVREGPLYTRVIERLEALTNSDAPEIHQEAVEALARLERRSR
jgi:hypothetical protein